MKQKLTSQDKISSIFPTKGPAPRIDQTKTCIKGFSLGSTKKNRDDYSLQVTKYWTLFNSTGFTLL